MFQIYQGKKRGLGVQPDQDRYVKIDFKFREVLHHFKGAKLGVLMSIMLHCDENGLSWPGYACIQRETGYGRDTIARALDELCEMIIEDNRVLMRWRERDTNGRFKGGNRYLIFPSKSEIQSMPELENPTMENATSGKHLLEEEPIVKEEPILRGKPPEQKKSTAQLDANGIAINNKHPQWEAFWNAVLSVKGLVQAKMTQQELANAAKVVREIIKPCAFEVSDVLAFPAFIREKEWGDWTINVIPTRISEVRQWRLQKNQSTDQPVITRPSESVPISDDVRKENRARVEAFERQRAEEAKRRGTELMGDDNE